MSRRRVALREVKIVAIYCRISRDIRGDQMGVDRQEAACRALVLARWGEGVVVLVYVDNDVSAYDRKVKRPEFERMLADAAAGAFDVIVAWDLDRIGRRLTDLERCVRIAEDTGVPMVTVNGDFDLTSAGGKAYARIVMAIAEMESDHKSERLVAKFEHDRELGLPQWRRRPFGYTIDAKLVPDEAAVLRDVAARAIEGETLTSLVRSVKNVPTPWGKPFTMLSLKTTLLSPRNVSKMTGRRDVIYGAGKWEPIFDDLTFQRLNGLTFGSARRMPTKATELCIGKLFCVHCDRKMYRKTDIARDRWDYLCRKQIEVGHHGCRMTATGSAVDKEVIRQLLIVLADEENRRRIISDNPDLTIDDEPAILDQIDDLTRRRSTVLKLVGEGIVEEDEAREQLGHLSRQLDEQRGALRSLNTNVRDASALMKLPKDAKKLALYWDKQTPEERRAVVAASIERIELRRATTKGGNSFETARVKILFCGGVEFHEVEEAA